MNKGIWIKKNTSGKVRDTLHWEDLDTEHLEPMKEFGLVLEEEIEGEKLLWFKDPVRIPKFNRFYASRITGPKDPYLLDLIKRLVYLNPYPDKLMIKKISEFIVTRFSVQELVESEVTGNKVYMPKMKFEEVEPLVVMYLRSRTYVNEDYVPDNETPVLFSRESKFNKTQKISILAYYRGILVRDLMESAIHTAAEHLIDKEENQKVTNSKIRGTGLVTTKRGLASVNTIVKYSSDRTKKIINEHNESAVFKTKKAENQYLQFLELPDHWSIDGVDSELNVSKSTVVEFKRLKSNGLLIN